MKIRKCSSTLAFLLITCLFAGSGAKAQVVNAPQATPIEGLHSFAGNEDFPAAYAADGTRFYLLDEQDGIRIRKTDATAGTMLAEVHNGAKGDSAIALTVDPSGNVYVVGTSNSGSLSSTSGVAFPGAAGNASNSFLAKYDANLNLIFLTFLGASDTAATGVAATTDAVFVTGTTSNAAFPASGVQRTPAVGSCENGFVERFSTDGSALVYSTYLTGADGNTLPSAIAADGSDNAYIAGSTSSTEYPTIAALQRSFLAADDRTTSGFLTRLNASGNAFVFSTYIAGTGITGLALDAAKTSLLLTGSIAFGQFPVPVVTKRLTETGQQALLHIPLDGQSVSAPVILQLNTQSDIRVAADNSKWIVPAAKHKSRGPSSANSAANVVNPNLSVSASSISFSTPVLVTQLAGSQQILTVTNSGSNSMPLTFAISGDFTLVDGCPAVLQQATSCLLEIGFAPSQPGERDGVLSVTTSSGFTPTYVSLTGTGIDILPANDGTLDLEQTLQGEPIVAWYKVQQPLVSLTAATNSSLFGVVLVPDTGSGHGSLPASSFSQSVTANCNNCWLGVQFYSQTIGVASASLVLTSNAGGSPYTLVLTGDALPVTGLVLSPVVQDFGSIAVNSTSAPITFMLDDLLASSSAVTVQSVSVTGDFTLVDNSSGGTDCTGVVLATGSCFVEVSFAPATTGQRDGVLTISTTEGAATATISGIGTADPGIGINPTSLSFVNVPGPSATQQAVVLKNTGVASLSVGMPSSSDPSFQMSSNCSTLQAAASCTIAVIFTPQNVTVSATLLIPVTSAANTTNYSVALAGAYTSQNSGLQIVANEMNFGSTATGALKSTRMFTLNNLTSEAMSIAFTLPKQFPLASADACATVPGNGSCSFAVTFLPVTGGSLTGTILAEGTPLDGAANVQGLAYMLGYGVASGSTAISGGAIPNTPVSFGEVNSGQTSQQVLTLTNNGLADTTIHRITSEPPFLSTSTCGKIMVPDASCTVTVTYAPIDEVSEGVISGARNDTGMVTIESDSISSPDVLQVSGIVMPIVSSTPASSAVLSAFSLSQGSLTFPNTQVGNASAKQVVTLTNTGNVNVQILSTIVSPDFTSSTTCATLLPGGSCNCTVQFTPTAATSSSVRSGTFEILSNAGTSLEFISLLGTSTPSALTLSPMMLDFGTVNVGSSNTLSITVTDTAATPVAFQGLSAGGDYSVNAGSCPATGTTLAAGSSCVLTVTFTPSALGTRTGTLSVANDASQLPLTAPLTGVAVEAQLRVTPGSLAFGSIDEGYPALLPLTLLNTGSESVTGIANAITGSDAGDFSVTAPCSVTTLAPNQGCSETVTFTPSAPGARLATLTVTSSDPNGPAAIALSGSGVQAGSFVLTVNGASAASVAVESGSSAVYALLLTPQNGFAGQAALTCTPITAGEYASCSLLASTLMLGSSALSSTATINTITSEVGTAIVALAGVLMIPFAGLRSKRRSYLTRLSTFSCLIFCLVLANGCGSGGGNSSTNVRTTPAGTYQYRVTASSTGGAPVSSSVTLTMVVQ